MPTSPTARPASSPTVWPARGRHLGADPQDLIRQRLRELGDGGTIDDHQEPTGTDSAPGSVFEARWRAPGDVTVRARLTLPSDAREGQAWVLVAEAESPWDQRWPSPATRFWPEAPDAGWDHDDATGLSLRDVNRLPADDKAVRWLFREAVRDSWNIHLVVHEAMTPDARGLKSLNPLLPESLRHRVVEHRASPQQLRAVNWALREIGVQVPRGGAVILPRRAASDDDFSVRSVFLDGSEPTELIDTLTRYAVSGPALPDGADDAVTALREQWQLLTTEEELDRERRLVAMYAEALDAMTRSRDLYREAAERAHEALAAYRESAPAAPEPPRPPSERPASPLQQLTRTLERLRGNGRNRPPHGPS
ncbi:hypothetical protein [Streptomyces sp. NPDC001658]